MLIILSIKQNKRVRQKYKTARGLDKAFEHQMPEYRGTTSLEVEKKDHNQVAGQMRRKFLDPVS